MNQETELVDRKVQVARRPTSIQFAGADRTKGYNDWKYTVTFPRPSHPCLRSLCDCGDLGDGTVRINFSYNKWAARSLADCMSQSNMTRDDICKLLDVALKAIDETQGGDDLEALLNPSPQRCSCNASDSAHLDVCQRFKHATELLLDMWVGLDWSPRHPAALKSGEGGIK